MVEGSAEQVRQAPSRKRPVTLSVKARRLKKRLSVCDQATLRSLCDAFCLSAVLQPSAPALLSLLPVDAAVAAEEGLAEVTAELVRPTRFPLDLRSTFQPFDPITLSTES